MFVVIFGIKNYFRTHVAYETKNLPQKSGVD